MFRKGMEFIKDLQSYRDRQNHRELEHPSPKELNAVSAAGATGRPPTVKEYSPITYSGTGCQGRAD